MPAKNTTQSEDSNNPYGYSDMDWAAQLDPTYAAPAAQPAFPLAEPAGQSQPPPTSDPPAGQSGPTMRRRPPATAGDCGGTGEPGAARCTRCLRHGMRMQGIVEQRWLLHYACDGTPTGWNREAVRRRAQSLSRTGSWPTLLQRACERAAQTFCV